jgi:hypothetical protein
MVGPIQDQLANRRSLFKNISQGCCQTTRELKGHVTLKLTGDMAMIMVVVQSAWF